MEIVAPEDAIKQANRIESRIMNNEEKLQRPNQKIENLVNIYISFLEITNTYCQQLLSRLEQGFTRTLLI
jgi:hypothetical protein